MVYPFLYYKSIKNNLVTSKLKVNENVLFFVNFFWSAKFHLNKYTSKYKTKKGEKDIKRKYKHDYFSKIGKNGHHLFCYQLQCFVTRIFFNSHGLRKLFLAYLIFPVIVVNFFSPGFSRNTTSDFSLIFAHVGLQIIVLVLCAISLYLFLCSLLCTYISAQKVICFCFHFSFHFC